jgi:hypothetical protein
LPLELGTWHAHGIFLGGVSAWSGHGSYTGPSGAWGSCERCVAASPGDGLVRVVAVAPRGQIRIWGCREGQQGAPGYKGARGWTGGRRRSGESARALPRAGGNRRGQRGRVTVTEAEEEEDDEFRTLLWMLTIDDLQ